jgi:hypothetical protein
LLHFPPDVVSKGRSIPWHAPSLFAREGAPIATPSSSVRQERRDIPPTHPPDHPDGCGRPGHAPADPTADRSVHSERHTLRGRDRRCGQLRPDDRPGGTAASAPAAERPEELGRRRASARRPAQHGRRCPRTYGEMGGRDAGGGGFQSSQRVPDRDGLIRVPARHVADHGGNLSRARPARSGTELVHGRRRREADR